MSSRAERRKTCRWRKLDRSSAAVRAATLLCTTCASAASCCRKLATKGYAVVVVYNSGEPEARKVVEAITAEGGRAVALQADVGDEAQVVRLFGQVDCVIQLDRALVGFADA